MSSGNYLLSLLLCKMYTMILLIYLRIAYGEISLTYGCYQMVF